MSRIKNYICVEQDAGRNPLDPNHIINAQRQAAEQLLLHGLKPMKGERLENLEPC